ncbi:MAG: hypothetical protein GXO87_11265 [Chlorobi bacterium]|nr:hypothetical protein [Chlorobiota bacterium]
MKSLKIIWTIALTEMKILSRSWFFRIFAALSILLLIGFDLVIFTDITGGFIPRTFYGLSASIVYSNILIFNLTLSVITVFLASDFLKRDKKLDTTDTVYIRSITNSGYVFGKALGIFLLFFLLNLAVLFISIFFALIQSAGGFNLGAYFYYPLLISLPSLLFIIGLSFLLMTLIKNQAVTFILLLGYIATIIFFFGNDFHNALDFSAFFTPMTFSDFVGFGNINLLLAQRITYAFLGLGFIFLTIYFFNRLPQSKFVEKFSAIIGIVLILSSGYFIYGYLSFFSDEANLREQMIELNEKYAGSPKVSLEECKIDFKHEGNSISCVTKELVKNKTEETIDDIIFSLNPGLKIKSISSNGKALPFKREGHLAFAAPEKPLLPGDSLSLTIQYSGIVNDGAAYLDIGQDKRNALEKIFIQTNYKKFSFVTPEYVLLTKENLWYPVFDVTYNPQNQFYVNDDFSKYEISVTTDKSLTAISQGKAEGSGGKFVFKPETLLPGVSLVIGKYAVQSVTVDSTAYSLYYLPSHNYFEKYFTEIGDTLATLIKDEMESYERDLGLTYPYSQLSLVETPIHFASFQRLWTLAEETTQPQIVFLPENSVGLDDADFEQSIKMRKRFGNRGNQVISPKESQTNMFKRFIKGTLLGGTPSFRFRFGSALDMNRRPYSIFPNFFTFTNYLSSKSFPIFNTLTEYYLTQPFERPPMRFIRNILGMLPEEKALYLTKGNSLKKIISDTTFNDNLKTLLKLKSKYFFTEIAYGPGVEKTREFLLNNIAANRFTDLGFTALQSEFKNQFNVDLIKTSEELMNASRLPGFFISDIKGYKILVGEKEKYQITFNITNDEKTDGIVDVKFTGRRGAGSGSPRFMRNGNNDNTLAEKIVKINAKRSVEVGTLLDDSPGSLEVNTIISKNLPLSLSFPFEDLPESKTVKPFEGNNILENKLSFVNGDEIIVDNEDSNFTAQKSEGRSFLKKLLDLSTDNSLPYKGIRFWNPPSDWEETIVDNAYGKYIHSVYFTEAGDGGSEVSWKTEIPKTGYYDVYAYVVNIKFGFRRRNQNKRPNNHYFVSSDDGEDEITLEMENADDGWTLLGSYYFSQGETKVRLTNKADNGLIFADAVKWVKRK